MKNKVFISYKSSINGIPTMDSKMAEELYEELMNVGINTFFAGKTLLKYGTDEYKEHIDNELDNCIILVVVGTSVENIASRWVKYEWDSFYMDILNGCKMGKVFTYVDGINPHLLPRALRRVQSFDKNKATLSTIVEFVKNAIASIEDGQSVDMEHAFDDGSVVKESKIDSLSEAYKLSVSFLHSGATQLKTSSLECVETEISRISSLFKYIHVVKHRDEIIESEDVASTIYDIICNSFSSNNSKLLKIKGPLGSYKNRLLQYIYLKLVKRESEILPFYIDVAMYEKNKGMQNDEGRKKLESLVREHFSCIKKCIIGSPASCPIIIIDGIRDFSSGKDSLYSIIKLELPGINCKLIVSMDTDFTYNSKNKFSLHPLAGTDFEYFIRISSMSTYNKERSIQFVKNCIDVFHINMPYDGVDECAIYDRLVNLGVTSLDAYWLKNLLTEMLGNILNTDITIADLYESICLRDIDLKSLPDAAKLAYEYEYGNINFSDSDFYFDKRWKIIRKHRTVLEYLIARYYIYRFDNLGNKDDESIEDQLHFFCMVLPKSVTLFITPMFRRFDDYESKVFSIAKHYYVNMSSFERNQLVYWLGRVDSKVRKEECNTFLKNKWIEQRSLYFGGSYDNNNQKKTDAFLYRTISVGLIRQGDKDVAKDYFDSLLNDKICNEINRGFHLEYYGDKPYIPNKTMLDFSDDVKHGIRTLDSLCVSIDAKKKSHVFNYMLILDLFTICSLLQARVDAKSKRGLITTYMPYAIKTIEYIKWIIAQRRLCEFENMKMYFEWILGELEKYYIKDEVYYPAKILDIMGKAEKIKRTGWVNRNVSNPENIIEHMYSCWLIGVLFLPDKTDDDEYDKNIVLNMLLIHDLGESETGDIPRPDKKQNRQYYDDCENRILQSLFLSRTYPNSICLSNYAIYWDKWYKADGINALVAKDIDIIQSIYKYCCYYINSEIDSDSDDMQNWFDELYDVCTQVGRHVVEVLILKNPSFESLVSKYGRTTEEYYG